MKRVYKRIRKTHPPSYASKFKESSRDKLQSRGRKYVAYNPFLAFHRSLSASYYRLHWIQKSEGWIIIAGNVNSTMAETLASATPLFERSPIVDAPKRGGVVGPLAGRTKSRNRMAKRSLASCIPAGRKNGSTVAFNRKTIGRLNRSRLGKRGGRVLSLVDSINRIVYPSLGLPPFRSSWMLGKDAGRVDG